MGTEQVQQSDKPVRVLWECPECFQQNTEYEPRPVNAECERCGRAFVMAQLFAHGFAREAPIQ